MNSEEPRRNDNEHKEDESLPENNKNEDEKSYIEEIEHCSETGQIAKRILYDKNHEIQYIEVYQNGQLELFSHYQESKLHGITQVNHNNGYPMSRIHFENGLMDGLAVSYDEEGAITTIRASYLMYTTIFK